MSLAPRPLALGASIVVAASIVVDVTPARSAGGGAGIAPPSSRGTGIGAMTPSGGVPIGGLAPTGSRTSTTPALPSKRGPGHWLRGVTLTEYWPAPEAWFVGRLVSAPGLPGKHRIDWLYSASGISMQGEGVGLDGQIYHVDRPGNGGWVTADGTSTSPAGGWAAGSPFWRQGGYWQNRSGAVTFPLQQGGWSAGPGRGYVPLPGVTFSLGASQPLHYYQSIAVDPNVIPLGSRVYIPSYQRDGFGGWFVAQDTGGAISGRHVDVYRSPPSSPTATGRYLVDQRIYVIKPRSH
jgi:3D (Asp-Asp-Asp) domain-containing protein